PEELRKTRYLFLKNPDRLTEEQEQRLRSLTRFDLGSIKAYILKLGLQIVYCAENRQEAEILLKSWYRRAVRSKVERIVKLAKTVKEHWQGILSYFDSRLTNGFLEGINSLVQAAKAKARGYRNPDNLIAMAYLIAGKLEWASSNFLNPLETAKSRRKSRILKNSSKLTGTFKYSTVFRRRKQPSESL
ncbi:transposase, partial [Desulfuromonas thiophila]